MDGLLQYDTVCMSCPRVYPVATTIEQSYNNEDVCPLFTSKHFYLGVPPTYVSLQQVVLFRLAR